MGCCQSRYTHFKKNRGKTLTPMPGKSPLLVRALFKEQAWEHLGFLFYDNSEVTTSIKLFWAAPPKSIGALAITYLAIQGLKDMDNIKTVVDTHMVFLLESIKKGTDDMRENSLILLSLYVAGMNDISVFVLLSFKIFNVLVRFFLCSKPEVRLICAYICNSVYKGRKSAQDAFIYENGGTLLMNLIQWHSNEESNHKRLLNYLENLILDSNKRPVLVICRRVNNTLAGDILRENQLKWKGTSLEEKIADLINILKNS